VLKELGKLTPYLRKKVDSTAIIVCKYFGWVKCQGSGRSDCLIKTQDFAKLFVMYEVWGLPGAFRLINIVKAVKGFPGKRRL
jgi:hypothetical protein